MSDRAYVFVRMYLYEWVRGMVPHTELGFSGQQFPRWVGKLVDCDHRDDELLELTLAGKVA